MKEQGGGRPSIAKALLGFGLTFAITIAVFYFVILAQMPPLEE